MSLDYDKLRQVLEAMPMKFADDSLKKNASAAQNVGLEVRVTRIYDGIGVHDRKDECQWCISRCGKDMTLQEAYAKGSFERHPGCECEIFYTTSKGTKRQTDWSTNTWTDMQDDDILENRKNYLVEDETTKKDLLLKGLRSGTPDDYIVKEHDPPVHIKTIEFNDMDQIDSVLKDFEEDVVGSSIETAIVITVDGNVYKCFGVKDQVYPDFDLGEKIRGSIISHFHPISSTEYSFSDTDRMLFFDYDLKCLRGKDDIYTYQMDRNIGSIDEIPEDGLRFEDYRHTLMIRDAKRFGFGYHRWKNE